MLQEVTHDPRAQEGTPEESFIEKAMGERTTELGTAGTSL